MADIQPLQALHYDLAAAGPLQQLIAPPYDVIDAAYRSELASRSPYNVVEIDLPEGEDAYGNAARLLTEWREQGIVAGDTEPALWAIQQDFTGPDGSNRTRQGFFCRVRLDEYGAGRVRPHERTHPAAKEDRLKLMQATKANLSPIFSLFADEGEAWAALEPHTHQQPWGEATDDEQTVQRLWRISDPDAIARVQKLLLDKELLIADGHHRYETARTYAEQIGGEGDHQYVLMCLVSMSDPGLAVFPTHRLVGGVDADARQALDELLESSFNVTEVERSALTEEGGGETPSFGLYDHESGRSLRIELRSQQLADEALDGHSAAYRSLDTAVLETLILKGALGLTEDDISHQNGLAYARNLDQAQELMDREGYQLAFMLQSTPIQQVRAVAEAGETMPPKSTYFFPKLPSGLLFNPLA